MRKEGEIMLFRTLCGDKKAYLSLLLLADEQENMVDLYLERGTVYVLEEDGKVKAQCVVTNEGGGILEIKNIAVLPECQRQGYGKALIDFISRQYKGSCSVLRVGTGDSPLTLPFYLACGFHRAYVIPNFFIDHYDHPIIEDGNLLRDMIVLQKAL